jgi:outer membrane protein assembly factor BamD
MRLLTISVFAIFLFTSCSRFSKVMKSNDYDYKLRVADKYYADKDYNHAQQLFEELFRVFKGSEHFEDIYYKFEVCVLRILSERLPQCGEPVQRFCRGVP